MEHLINSIEGLFKEDLYQGFPEHVSVDEYIDLVADYIEDDCLGAGYLRGLKGKSLREIENIVLLGRNLGRFEEAHLVVLLRFFHEQDERQGQRPRSVICAHPKRVVVGDWY